MAPTTRKIGSHTIRNQIAAVPRFWRTETMVAAASSTTAAGSHPLLATWTATTGTL